MVKMEQVHGNNVVCVRKKDDGKTIKNCDALVTNEKNLELCVRVADCLPVAVYDFATESIGLFHAGWRGLASGVIKNGIGLMVREFGSKPEEIIVYMGPHICKKHYEVGKEVAEKFDGQRFLDLGKVAVEQLTGLGIKNKNITIDPLCTFENRNLFSYRRGDKISRNLYLLKLDK